MTDDCKLVDLFGCIRHRHIRCKFVKMILHRCSLYIHTSNKNGRWPCVVICDVALDAVFHFVYLFFRSFSFYLNWKITIRMARKWNRHNIWICIMSCWCHDHDGCGGSNLLFFFLCVAAVKTNDRFTKSHNRHSHTFMHAGLLMH